MGLKMPVPDPTEKDFQLSKPGFETWYEHDSGCIADAGKPEDWKQEVLSLIRLANHYKKLAENTRLRSGLAAIRDAGDEEIERLKDSCLILEFFRPSLRASIESIIKHERHHFKRTDDEIRSGVAAGMRNAVGENSMDWIASLQSQIDSLTAERDEAISLLRWLRRLAEGKHIEFRDGTGHAETNRLLELTAK